ncbi:FtsX-like permease family protein [Arthrobacter sp. R1-13]
MGAGAALWLLLDKEISGDAVRDVQQSVATALGVPAASVSGAVIERVTFNEIMDALLLVVTGLLGVAVVIALMGVAGTLSLSVLERTRENSLLPAIGLTLGQLRGMLAIEAVLVAGVAAGAQSSGLSMAGSVPSPPSAVWQMWSRESLGYRCWPSSALRSSRGCWPRSCRHGGPPGSHPWKDWPPPDPQDAP